MHENSVSNSSAMNFSFKKGLKDPRATFRPPILSPVGTLKSEMNTGNVLNSGADFVCVTDVPDRPANLFQSEAPLPLPASSNKATPSKKVRGRRKRYVYSKPKKRSKKTKEAPQTLVEVPGMQQSLKNENGNHASDSTIVDDSREEISSRRTVNLSNRMSEKVKLQPHEMGKLLIRDGMFTNSNKIGPAKNKSEIGNSKSTIKHFGGERLVYKCNLGRSLLSNKRKSEEPPVESTETCKLSPVLNQVGNILPADRTAEESSSAISFLVSPSVRHISPPEIKRRRPQTARRGRKLFVSSGRVVNEPRPGDANFVTEACVSTTKQNIITDQVDSAALKNDLIRSQFHGDVEERLPTFNCFETYAVEMTMRVKPTAKRSTSRKKAETSVSSSSEEASSYPLGYANGFILPEDVVMQKSSREKSTQKSKTTKTVKSKQLPSELEANSFGKSPPAKKVKVKAPEKTPNSFLVSPSVSHISPPEIKRRPQTARRGRKLFVSSGRVANEPLPGDANVLTEACVSTTSQNIITDQVDSAALKNDSIRSQFHGDVEERLPTFNRFETYAVEMAMRVKPAAKRSTSRKKAENSVFSSSEEASSFPLGHANGFVLPEDAVMQKSSREKSAQKSKTTKTVNSKQSPSELEAYSFGKSPPAKKVEVKAPEKTPKNKPLERAIFIREDAAETKLMTPVKKELCDDSYLDVNSLRPNVLKQPAGTSEMDSDGSVMPSSMHGNSIACVSLSFVEDTSKEEADESLSFLLSLKKRRSVTENSRALKVLKNDHQTMDEIKMNDEKPPNLTFDSNLTNLYLQSEADAEDRLTRGTQNSELCLQRSSLSMDVSKVKKENEDASTEKVISLEHPKALDKSISSESVIARSNDLPDSRTSLFSHVPNVCNPKRFKTVSTSSDKAPANIGGNAIPPIAAVKEEPESRAEKDRRGLITRLSNNSVKDSGRKSMAISLANSKESDSNALPSTSHANNVPANKMPSNYYKNILQLESPSVEAKANTNSTSQSLLVSNNTPSSDVLNNSAPAQRMACASSCNKFTTFKEEPQEATLNTVNVVRHPSTHLSAALQTKEQLISGKLSASNLVSRCTTQSFENNFSFKAEANSSGNPENSCMQDSVFNLCIAAAIVKQEVYGNAEKNTVPAFHENTTSDETDDRASLILENCSNGPSSINHPDSEVSNIVTSCVPGVVKISGDRTQPLLECSSWNSNKNATSEFYEANIKKEPLTHTSTPSACIKKEIGWDFGFRNNSYAADETSSNCSCNASVLNTNNDTTQPSENIRRSTEKQGSSSKSSSDSLESRLQQESLRGACCSSNTAEQDISSSFKVIERNVLDSVSNLSAFRAMKNRKDMNSKLVVARDSTECDSLLAKVSTLILEEGNASIQNSLSEAEEAPRSLTPINDDSLHDSDSIHPSPPILENYLDSLLSLRNVTVPALTTEEQIVGKFDLFVNFRKKVKTFFKHPHPGDSILKFMQISEPKSKYYSRLEEVSSNLLSFEEVASRLQMAVANDFDSVTGESGTLEGNFPFIKEEIGCYHKLLCVVPSLNLISQRRNSHVPQESTILTEESITVSEPEILRHPSPSILRTGELSPPNQNGKKSGDLPGFDEKCASSLTDKIQEVGIPFLNEYVSPPRMSSSPSPTTETSVEISDLNTARCASQETITVLENNKSKVQQIDELKHLEINTQNHPHQSQDSRKEVEENIPMPHSGVILLENYKASVQQLSKPPECSEKSTKDLPSVSQDACEKLGENTAVYFTEICTDSQFTDFSSSISAKERPNGTCSHNEERNASFTEASVNVSLSEATGNSSSISISATVNNQKTLNSENNALSDVQNTLKDINLPRKEMPCDLIQTARLKSSSESRYDYLGHQRSEIMSVDVADSMERHSEEHATQYFLISDESPQRLPTSITTPAPLSPLSEASHTTCDGNQLHSSDKALLSAEHSELLAPKAVDKTASEPTASCLTEEQSSPPFQLPTYPRNESHGFRNDTESQLGVQTTFPVLSRVDVQPTEILKPLQAANTLPPSEYRELPPSSENFKDTYNYGHTSLAQNSLTQRGYNRDILPDNRYLDTMDCREYCHFYEGPPLLQIPVVRDYGHKPATEMNFEHHSSCAGTLAATNRTTNNVCGGVSISSRHSYASDSDGNNKLLSTDAELHNTSTYDKKIEGIPANSLTNENNSTNTKNENVRNTPQNRSRRGKIMGRKSLETPSRAKSVEHVFKDCYPVKWSRDKSNRGRPIARVQPCCQKVTKIPSNARKFFSGSQKSFDVPKKTQKGRFISKRNEMFKNKKRIKYPLKSKPLESNFLFQPDKVVNNNEAKANFGSGEKTSGSDVENRVYSPVANRGTFMAQSSVSQPSRPAFSVRKKSVDKPKDISEAATERFNFKIHSPRIENSSANKSIKSNHLRKPSWKSKCLPSFRTDTITNADVSSSSSFLMPKPGNSSFILSSFSAPESEISPNVSVPVLPNIQQDQRCLPHNAVPLPNAGLGISQTGKRTLLPTPPSIFPMKTKRRVLLPTPSQFKSSNLNQDLPSTDFDMDNLSPAIPSPSLAGSTIDSNVKFPILNDPPNPQSQVVPSTVHSTRHSGQHGQPRSRLTKCVCLPPGTLKASVGNAAFETVHVLWLILEWNVDWFVQHQRNNDPPPISNSVRRVANTYEDCDEYYNTYLPLMLLETWQRLYMSWTHLNHTSPYFCEIKSYTVETHSIKVECHASFKASDTVRRIFPEEGSIITVKFATKDKGGIKILGYVRDVEVKDFEINKVPKNEYGRTVKYAPREKMQMLLLTFVGAYTSDDFDINQLIRIKTLCNIKSTLKQNDAMLNLRNSPLCKNVLNPLNDRMRIVDVVSHNIDPAKMRENFSRCVRDVVEGISSPDPLLAVVKSSSSFDCLKIILPLIEKMKYSFKAKVLLCAKTTKTLTDIGFKLAATQTIRIVIIGKRTDVPRKLRKHFLDDIATERLDKCSSKDPASKAELLESAKMDVLRDCHVILSLTRNCRNDLVAQTFSDRYCISQMCCIVDEANLCTEPEILIPLLYGVSKLILIGDPNVHAKVCSKAASNCDYSRSIFHRACELNRTSK